MLKERKSNQNIAQTRRTQKKKKRKKTEFVFVFSFFFFFFFSFFFCIFMFLNFCQQKTFVSREKPFVSRKSFCIPKKFFVSQNKHHLRGTLLLKKSILYPQKGCLLPPHEKCTSDEYSWQNFLAKLAKLRLVSCRNRTMFDHCPKRNQWAFEWFSEPHEDFSIFQEALDISQTAIAPHRASPPFFNPILIVAILLNLRTAFQRCHLSRIDEVLKFGDSMIELHQIFPNANELSVQITFDSCDGSRNFREFLSVSCEIFVLHG